MPEVVSIYTNRYERNASKSRATMTESGIDGIASQRCSSPKLKTPCLKKCPVMGRMRELRTAKAERKTAQPNQWPLLRIT